MGPIEAPRRRWARASALSAFAAFGLTLTGEAARAQQGPVTKATAVATEGTVGLRPRFAVLAGGAYSADKGRGGIALRAESFAVGRRLPILGGAELDVFYRKDGEVETTTVYIGVGATCLRPSVSGTIIRYVGGGLYSVGTTVTDSSRSTHTFGLARFAEVRLGVVLSQGARPDRENRDRLLALGLAAEVALRVGDGASDLVVKIALGGIGFRR